MFEDPYPNFPKSQSWIYEVLNLDVIRVFLMKNLVANLYVVSHVQQSGSVGPNTNFHNAFFEN